MRKYIFAPLPPLSDFCIFIFSIPHAWISENGSPSLLSIQNGTFQVFNKVMNRGRKRVVHQTNRIAFLTTEFQKGGESLSVRL